MAASAIELSILKLLVWLHGICGIGTVKLLIHAFLKFKKPHIKLRSYHYGIVLHVLSIWVAFATIVNLMLPSLFEKTSLFQIILNDKDAFQNAFEMQWLFRVCFASNFAMGFAQYTCEALHVYFRAKMGVFNKLWDTIILLGVAGISGAIFVVVARSPVYFRNVNGTFVLVTESGVTLYLDIGLVVFEIIAIVSHIKYSLQIHQMIRMRSVNSKREHIVSSVIFVFSGIVGIMALISLKIGYQLQLESLFNVAHFSLAPISFLISNNRVIGKFVGLFGSERVHPVT